LWVFFTFRLPQNILFDDPEYHVTLEEQKAVFLDAIQPGARQFVLWHCSLPHSPFLYTAGGSRHHEYPDFFPFEKEYKKSQFPIIFNRYRDQVKYADRILGQIVQKLKSTGAYRDSILIVTSDHGVRIWGDLFRNINLIARVPVFIRVPGRPPAAIDSEFELVDLAPTLLDATGHSSQSHFDGYSLFSGTHGERSPKVYFHPAEFAYLLDSKTGEWNRWLPAGKKRSIDTVPSPSISQERGFFAVQVVDDAVMAHEQGMDFLTRYLQLHFPKSVTDADLRQLEVRIRNMDRLPATPPNQFKRGINYFFLSLVETQLISSGAKLSIPAVNQHWAQARDILKTAGDLQPLIADAIGLLLDESDSNSDGHLDEQELTHLIKSRINAPS
jgi:sulfatase-like protein